MLNIVILSLTMIYLSVATSYTSYTRSLSNMPPLLVCSNTRLKRGGNLKYHTTTTTITNKRDMSIITKMGMSDGYLNNLNFPQYVNTNLSSLNLTKSDYYKNMPNTGDNISISSIYLNIDKMNGVYFSRMLRMLFLHSQKTCQNSIITMAITIIARGLFIKYLTIPV